MVHLCGKRYAQRAGDTTKIRVYSNQPKVSLYLNGKLAIFADSQTETWVQLMKFIQPLPVIFHFSSVPAKIMVIANDICNMMHRALHGRHGNMGNGGKSGRIQPLCQPVHKELGANTIRLAHYQHAQEFYDACDEMGFVVWAEIPFISVFNQDPQAHQNCISQLKEKFLCMLIMGQPNRIRPQFFDQLCIPVVIFFGQRISAG